MTPLLAGTPLEEGLSGDRNRHHYHHLHGNSDLYIPVHRVTGGAVSSHGPETLKPTFLHREFFSQDTRASVYSHRQTT